MELIVDNTGENLEDLGFVSGFSDIAPKGRSMEDEIDTLDFIKIKNSSVKDKRELKAKLQTGRKYSKKIDKAL